jgi:hypothetical protein
METMTRFRRAAVVALVLVASVVACGGGEAAVPGVSVERGAAAADVGPGPTVVAQRGTLVSLGDSYISGTAGRWKGNTNGFTNIPRDLDAFRRADTGADAYDNFGVEFPGEECFRSRSAAIHLGGDWASVNMACSNARTASRASDEEGKDKPGIDAAGQLSSLATVAGERSDAGEPISMIAVSIGANDFRFGPVMRACATAFLTSSSVSPRLCSTDPEVLAYVSPAAVETVRASIARALGDIVATMRDAGYVDDTWTLISHNYPAPLPPSSQMRYGQFGYTRQVTGGCPFYDADLDWLGTWFATVNRTVADAVLDAERATGIDIVTLDMANLFEGRRLCERGTKLVEQTADEAELLRYAERVDMIRLTSKLPGSPYNLNEGVHPNHLGQMAIRACLRAAFGDGAARSGVCSGPDDWGVVDTNGEPAIRFTPT